MSEKKHEHRLSNQAKTENSVKTEKSDIIENSVKTEKSDVTENSVKTEQSGKN